MIRNGQESQDTVYTPESTMIQICLDGIATRMCLKYKLDPKKFVLKCLQDELHRLAVEEEMTEGVCPRCGRGKT